MLLTPDVPIGSDIERNSREPSSRSPVKRCDSRLQLLHSGGSSLSFNNVASGGGSRRRSCMDDHDHNTSSSRDDRLSAASEINNQGIAGAPHREKAAKIRVQKLPAEQLHHDSVGAGRKRKNVLVHHDHVEQEPANDGHVGALNSSTESGQLFLAKTLLEDSSNNVLARNNCPDSVFHNFFDKSPVAVSRCPLQGSRDAWRSSESADQRRTTGGLAESCKTPTLPNGQILNCPRVRRTNSLTSMNTSMKYLIFKNYFQASSSRGLVVMTSH